MYIPGRLRTGSSPRRTVMSADVYSAPALALVATSGGALRLNSSKTPSGGPAFDCRSERNGVSKLLHIRIPIAAAERPVGPQQTTCKSRTKAYLGTVRERR